MSKVCCVSQCPSKSGSVENTRNLFGINRDSPTYDSVLNAIGQNLKQKVIPKHLFICDLHFEDNCIERTDIKIWKDGEEVSIPRKIARLKAGSLPTIFPSKFSKENNECRKEVLRPVNVNNETANTQQISPTEPLQKNEASVDKYFPSEVTGMEQKDQDSENDEFLTSPVAPRMVKPAPGCTSFTSSANYVKDESLRPRICFNQNCTPFETQYTLEALMQDWKSSANERKVPGDWALVDSNFGVLLVYCGDTHEIITRSVLVKNDMSVEVRYKERIAASPSIDKVSNFQQLLWFLLVVTCSHVCEGIENHQSCPNVFYIRKPKTRCNRCPDCQIEAKKHRRREQRRILREEKEEKVVKDSRYVKFALSADENICYNCHKTLDNFARFIHRCNTVKVTLDDIKIEIDEAISSDEDDTPELSKPLSEAISLDEDDKPELFKSLSEAISLDEDDKQELFNPLSEAISLDEDDKPEPFNPLSVFHTYCVKSEENGFASSVEYEIEEDNVPNKVITAAPMDKKATMCMSCKAPINILEGDDPTETHCNKCLLTAVISDDSDTASVPELENSTSSSDESSLQVKSVDGINPFKVHVYNSMYEHALKPHDTVVSSPLPAENIANIIKDFSNVGVDVLQLVSGTSTTTKKRILLFGSTLFKCDECNMEFEGQSSYLDHLKEVHEVTRHPKLDKEGFDQIITKLEGNNKVRLCPICKKFLVDGRQLQAHINAFHKKPVTFKCQKCNKSFKYKRTLDKHMIDFKEFNNCNYRRCKVCGEKVNRMEYEEHLKLHTGRFICENCGRDFATLISLRRHDEIKHQTKEEKHLCPICGTMYSSREYLNFHMRCHREQDEGVMYLCDQCPRSYVTRIRLMCHIKRVHASAGEWKCSECDKVCLTYKSLVNHKMLKHSKDSKYICEICGAGFVRGDYYRRHKRGHEIKPNYKSGLPRRKYKNPHSPAMCKYCLKECSNVYTLKTHIIHSHVKSIRYKCRYCGTPFSSPANRLRHEKRHNDPRYELSCNICWKRHDTKEDLEMHMTRHEMKYSCAECGELVATKNQLRNHMSENHVSKEYIEKEKEMFIKDGLQEYTI